MWKPSTFFKQHLIPVAALLFAVHLLANQHLVFTQELYQRIADTFGEPARQRVGTWQNLLEEQTFRSEQHKLETVNTFFNRRQFIADSQHWGTEDYWATPIEFLATDGGDCEDFSIAKYVSLRALGVPADKMRLMYVKAIKLNQAHMVLAYYDRPDAIPYILDNINRDILPASERADLVPVYSFNGDGLWLAKAQGRGKKVQEKGNHSLWEEVTKRIERGF